MEEDRPQAFLEALDSRLCEFIDFMEGTLVPHLKPDYQQQFFEKVKATFLKAQSLTPEGGVNPLIHATIGPKCLSKRTAILKVKHYLEKTPVPQGEIVQMDFFPRGDLIDDPERMFREARREDLVTMFCYFDEFGKLYWQYLKKTDPVLLGLYQKLHKEKATQ